MSMRKVPDRKAVNIALSGLVLALIGAGCATPAEARHRHHHAHFAAHHSHVAHHARVRFHARHGVSHVAAAASVGGTASIVVDGVTGRVISAMNENAPRHPASVTKVMTLYLLFEALEKGKLSLDDEIPVSAHAAAQAPSKLGLRPGQTIRVEDAIKVIVTKSANDIAVAVAEAVGGTESDFADMMTRKAHALGMTRTVYRNASGLPNDEQITTASDLAVLGRTIQANFPRYYRYFSIHEFAYHGQRIHTHNHLMDRLEGMDGIKTGYTAASGFNLLSSVKRDGHYIVSVVMGGKSARSRDNYMEALIEQHIDEGGSPRGVTRLAEAGPAAAPATNWWGGREEQADLPSRSEPAPTSVARPVDPPNDLPSRAEAEPKPAPTRVVANPTPHAEPKVVEAPRLQVAALAPVARPRPAYVSAAAMASDENDDDATSTAAIPRHHTDGSTARRAPAAVTPSATHPAEGKNTMRVAIAEPPVRPVLKSDVKPDSGDSLLPKSDKSSDKNAQSGQFAASKPAVSGWVIQIGATDDAGKAAALLVKARSQKSALLSTAHPFTEMVRKGHETLYRARFAGLEESKAEAACKALKTSGFNCFASRN
jgi:D-alanyl-D-alanine carboxypeptidase